MARPDFSGATALINNGSGNSGGGILEKIKEKVNPTPKLDDVLAGINRELYKEYQDVGIPAEDRLFDQLNVDTTKSSMKDAITARRMLGQVDERNKSRYGVSQNSAQRGNQSRMDSLAGARAIGDAGNSAIIADEDRKLNTLQTLINQGSGLRNSAQGGLGVAAQNEARRDSAYDAAKQQHKTNQMNTLGSLAGMAAMAFI